MAAPVSAVLVGSLATYRITRLMTTDTLTEPLRTRIWNRYPPESNCASYILTCEHCSAVYAAAAVTMLATGAMPQLPKPVQAVSNILLATLALSGAVSLYHDHVENRRV